MVRDFMIRKLEGLLLRMLMLKSILVSHLINIALIIRFY